MDKTEEVDIMYRHNMLHIYICIYMSLSLSLSLCARWCKFISFPWPGPLAALQPLLRLVGSGRRQWAPSPAGFEGEGIEDIDVHAYNTYVHTCLLICVHLGGSSQGSLLGLVCT